MTATDYSIGFIGAGHITHSLISGLIQSGFRGDQFWVADRHLEKREQIAKQFGVHIDASNQAIIKQSDVLVLAVKPKDMLELTHELKETIQIHHPLIISIATGIQISHFKHWLGSDIAIVRAMPNTPALLRAGATGLYANTQVTDNQKSIAESLMRAVGITVWVNHEHELDTIAALSGAGPAYFFLIMEALQQSAESLGLPKNIARLLTMQTTLGAARMALESEVDLAELRKRVSSPGGITEKALDVLESGDIRLLLQKTLEAAKERSIEISHQFD